MKKSKLVLAVIGLCVCLVGLAWCVAQSRIESLVSLSVEDTDITADAETISFAVVNKSVYSLTTGEDSFVVSRKQGEEYEPLNAFGFQDREIAFIIEANSTFEHMLPVEKWYGGLEAGEYRLSVTVSSSQGYITLLDDFVVKEN